MRLYVNVDHVATIRQARRTDEPDPVAAGLACEQAGADGVTVHLREDRRHIQDQDVRALAASVTKVLNLELATAPDIIALAAELKPHQATFVPERREEITTEGGLDLSHRGGRDGLEKAMKRLTAAGIRISLFIDPDAETVEHAAKLGAAAVEFHTGNYAGASPADRPRALERLQSAVRLGKERGLAIHAGHGLTYRNVKPVAAIREIEELNIGHSIVSRSITVGISAAVREMRALVDGARTR